jgi:DNA-binding transcriptional LysR family regulator
MQTTTVDLNLLRALEALLQEGSVTGAAARAGMTVPAMSRALGRLRVALQDQLLVRAGRGLVPTPLAVQLADRAQRAYAEATAVLAPEFMAQRARVLVIRASDGVAALLAGPLSRLAPAQAPGLRLRFVAEGDEDDEALREGNVALDIGVQHLAAPELKTRKLADDRFVAVVRRGHPLGRGLLTAERLSKYPHVVVSRTGRADGPLDAWLAQHGFQRQVAAVVDSFLAALLVAADSNLVAPMPGLLATSLGPRLAAVGLVLPSALPTIPIAMAWHPRFDDDHAHRWLRGAVVELAKGLGAPRRRVTS